MGKCTPRPRAARCPHVPAAPLHREEALTLPRSLPDRDPGTFPPGEPLASKRPAPLPPRCGRSSPSAWHTRAAGRCRAMSPRGRPCVLWLMGAGQALSIPPPGSPAGSSRAEGKQDGPPRGSGASMLYLQLSVGKQGLLCLFFGRADGQGKFTCLLGPGAVPPPHRLPLLFSGDNGAKFLPTALLGRLFPVLGGGGCGSSPAAPLLPPPPAHYPHCKTFRADAASYSVLT